LFKNVLLFKRTFDILQRLLKRTFEYMLKNLVEKLCPSDLREQRGMATRLRLVDAAIRLFGEKGFKAVSVRELADYAKTNLAAISYHFGDKSGLYREAFTIPVKELLSAAEGLNNPSLSFESFARAFYRSLLSALSQDEQRARLVMRMHHREMVEPSGMLASFIQEFAMPIHLSVLGRIHREIDPASFARAERADASIQRIAFMMFGLAMDFYVQSDFVEAFAPELIHGPKAIDDLIESLARAACGIVLAEKNGREPKVDN
jgi:TetR/AcrR family transcriptional regulator, regulator of cefoperazone and chloramphenicol sensitivity